MRASSFIHGKHSFILVTQVSHCAGASDTEMNWIWFPSLECLQQGSFWKERTYYLAERLDSGLTEYIPRLRTSSLFTNMDYRFSQMLHQPTVIHQWIGYICINSSFDLSMNCHWQNSATFFRRKLPWSKWFGYLTRAELLIILFILRQREDKVQQILDLGFRSLWHFSISLYTQVTCSADEHIQYPELSYWLRSTPNVLCFLSLLVTWQCWVSQ